MIKMTHSFCHNRRFEAMRVQNEHLSWSKKIAFLETRLIPRAAVAGEWITF